MTCHEFLGADKGYCPAPDEAHGHDGRTYCSEHLGNRAAFLAGLHQGEDTG